MPQKGLQGYLRFKYRQTNVGRESTASAHATLRPPYPRVIFVSDDTTGSTGFCSTNDVPTNFTATNLNKILEMNFVRFI